MIDVLIEPQNFELIRDQIAIILKLEFQNQITEFENTNCMGVNFFAERTSPMGFTEKDFINISLLKGDYNNKEMDYVDGTYHYVIDIVTGAKSTSQEPGDKLANFRLQKLFGIVRYILESSVYKTLLLGTPCVLHTEISKFQVYKPEQQGDSTNTTYGQALFTVRCGEVTTPITGNLITGADTSVFLELTNKGYQYAFISEGPTPPPDPRYVTIVDQYDNVLARLTGGEVYTVTVLKNIVDTIFNNQTTIIDNIIP